MLAPLLEILHLRPLLIEDTQRFFVRDKTFFGPLSKNRAMGSLRALRSEYTEPLQEVCYGQASSPSGDSTLENPANTKEYMARTAGDRTAARA